MSCREETLAARDGYELSLRVYEADGTKAVVKFIHGMEEHQERYQPFAEYLQAAGYTVVTADLRGHGKNAPRLSHIADEDGHLRLLEDDKKHRCVSCEGEITFPNYLRIDNTDKSAEDVAKLIKETFQL